MSSSKGTKLKSPSSPLPVPVSPGTLPTLTEHAQLDADLGALERALEGYRKFGEFFRPSTEERVNALMAALPHIDKWRANWRALDRPATTDEIATEMLRLATTMPSAGNIDQGMLADTLCDDIAELRPTAWELERGCRAHRGKSEFLSFAKLQEEIRRAQLRAKGYRRLLEYDLAKELERDEELLRDDRRQSAERKRQQKLPEKRAAEEQVPRWLKDLARDSGWGRGADE
jgi:hypothetical protein